MAGLESCGSFVDTLHLNLQHYINDFKLDTEDFNFILPEFYYLDPQGTGSTGYSLEQLVDALRQVVPYLQDDIRNLTPPNAIIGQQKTYTAFDRKMDNWNVIDYVRSFNTDRNPALPQSDVSKLLESAWKAFYPYEYADELTNINAMGIPIYLAHPSHTSRWIPTGVFDDSRYHVKGGNDQIPLNIARRVEANIPHPIRTNCPVVKIAQPVSGRVRCKLDIFG